MENRCITKKIKRILMFSYIGILLLGCNNILSNNKTITDNDQKVEIKQENDFETKENQHKNEIESNLDDLNNSKKNINNSDPKINITSKTLEEGKTFTLKVSNNKGKVSWSSSDKKIATVIEGKVTAVNKGTTIITASVDGKKLTCKVTVKETSSNAINNNTISNSNTNTNTGANNTVTNPKLNSTNVTIDEDKTYQLKVTENKGKVQWMTVDSSIAIVDNSGVIRPTKAGKTTVQAIVDGKTLTCNVTVKEVPVETSISKEAFNYINNERQKAGLTPYIWDSSFESTAKLRAEECLIKYAHVRPNGDSLATLNIQSEILTSAPSAKEAVDDWMNSSGHKKIVLKETATKCVVAKIFDQSFGEYVWVALINK